MEMRPCFCHRESSSTLYLKHSSTKMQLSEGELSYLCFADRQTDQIPSRGFQACLSGGGEMIYDDKHFSKRPSKRNALDVLVHCDL